MSMEVSNSNNLTPKVNLGQQDASKDAETSFVDLLKDQLLEEAQDSAKNQGLK